MTIAKLAAAASSIITGCCATVYPLECHDLSAYCPDPYSRGDANGRSSKLSAGVLRWPLRRLSEEALRHKQVRQALRFQASARFAQYDCDAARCIRAMPGGRSSLAGRAGRERTGERQREALAAGACYHLTEPFRYYVVERLIAAADTSTDARPSRAAIPFARATIFS